MKPFVPWMGQERGRGWGLNRWDAITLPFILSALALVAWGLTQMAAPMGIARAPSISLAPWHLPEYALRTVLRMLLGLMASLLFTLVYATLAAKSRRAEQILIPALDILQSVPVLGYLSFTVTVFLVMFPGRRLGPELAAIFAIFTAQAWNMTFSLYQSLKTLPYDLQEAAAVFHLSPWHRFWRLELPFAMPGLVWNAMMSMSGAWFFVVASEAITVGRTRIDLPGVGSYVAAAIERGDLTAIGYAIATMLVVIVLYDQLFFRPLVAWSDKFRVEESASQRAARSWLLDLVRRAAVPRAAGALVERGLRATFRLHTRLPRRRLALAPRSAGVECRLDRLWNLSLSLAGLAATVVVVRFVTDNVGWREAGLAAFLGLLTLARVLVLVALAALIWVPVGVVIGLRPRLAERTQALAQFLAAYPANLLFPIAVVLIVRYHVSTDIWLSPLMILGTQWYLLFNVIAGASAFPNDLRDAASAFRLRGRIWWAKVILPGIFPYVVTGAITASGGAWNASIVAESVSWGNVTLAAHGLGAYIAQWTTQGDVARVALGVGVMAVYVVLFNRLLWRRLYAVAERRLRPG